MGAHGCRGRRKPGTALSSPFLRRQEAQKLHNLAQRASQERRLISFHLFQETSDQSGESEALRVANAKIAASMVAPEGSRICPLKKKEKNLFNLFSRVFEVSCSCASTRSSCAMSSDSDLDVLGTKMGLKGNCLSLRWLFLMSWTSSIFFL